jgi:hypothetical protein
MGHGAIKHCSPVHGGQLSEQTAVKAILTAVATKNASIMDDNINLF